MKKLIKTAELRNVLGAYEKEKVSYSGMVEMLNEFANLNLEDDFNDKIQEIHRLQFKIQELNQQIVKMKVDRIAEMKTSKMLFSMILSDSHTHREKNKIAKLSNDVLNLNIEKIENDIYSGLKIPEKLPF